MKIVLTTTLVALLAIGLLGMNNAFAQENDTMSMQNEMENDTSMMMNATLPISLTGNDTAKPMNVILPTSIISNATLAFAQGDGGMMGNDTGGGMTMNMSSDHSKGGEMMSLNGTINVESTIAEAFKSKVTTDIVGAIQAAQASVGANSFVKEAELTHAHGYLVYKMKVVDENMKKYKVIVDPGNGQVLMKKEITWYEDGHKKMKYDEEKYDKYNYFSGHGIPDPLADTNLKFDTTH
ncbi:MAG TPA: PepSY domain-containing protein [Nitrososphaeraceae archaeon]|nr:PepSY domain-containing protein [Nitrososphaeraceae archaeon]